MLKANSKLNLGLMCNIIGSILIFLSDRELIFQLKKKIFIFLFFRKTECLIVIDYIPLWNTQLLIVMSCILYLDFNIYGWVDGGYSAIEYPFNKFLLSANLGEYGPGRISIYGMVSMDLYPKK